MRLLFAGFLALCSAAAADVGKPARPPLPVAEPAQTAAVAEWLRRSALPLQTVVAGNGFADLQSFKRVLADVRIVGLGEATHGTREFFQFKHRMVEFLVREMGFTLFIIEGSYAGVAALDEYVLRGGDGDPGADLTALMSRTLAVVWNTEEFQAMLLWMRDYNRSQPVDRKVRFLGFDPQLAEPSALALLGYLKRVAPDLVANATAAIKHLYPVNHKWAYSTFPRQPAAVRRAARDRLLKLLGQLALERPRLIAAGPAEEYEAALQHVRLLLQSDEIRNFSEDAREPRMAENVEHLLLRAGAGARAILWAHNFHLSRAAGGFRPWGRKTDFQPMGSHLARRFGASYYSLGFAFDHGGFQAGDEDAESAQAPFDGFREFSLPASAAGEAGWLLAQGGPLYLIDLRAIEAGEPAARWLASPQAMRWVGAGFSSKWPPSEFTESVVLKDHFDGLFFVAKTSRARPLPFNPTARPYKG
jgi:erythromycin esterase